MIDKRWLWVLIAVIFSVMFSGKDAFATPFNWTNANGGGYASCVVMLPVLCATATEGEAAWSDTSKELIILMFSGGLPTSERLSPNVAHGGTMNGQAPALSFLHEGVLIKFDARNPWANQRKIISDDLNYPILYLVEALEVDLSNFKGFEKHFQDDMPQPSLYNTIAAYFKTPEGTPEPFAIVLLGTGLIGIAGLRRMNLPGSK